MAVDYYGHKVNKSNIWHNLGHQITSKNHDTPKILYEMAEHDPLYDVITWWPDMTWQIFFLQKMHKVSLSNFYYGYDYLRCLVSTQSADLCRSEHENRVFPIDLHVCLSSSMADALEGGDFVTSSKRVYWFLESAHRVLLVCQFSAHSGLSTSLTWFYFWKALTQKWADGPR